MIRRELAKPFKTGDERMKVEGSSVRLCFVVMVALLFLLQFHLFSSISSKNNSNSSDSPSIRSEKGMATSVSLSPQPQQKQEHHHDRRRCAINLFGLPRAFASLVLPSLIRNVIRPNARYHCDYFVHYYQLEHEVSGRSGQGGAVHPEQILLLKQHVLEQHVKINNNNNNDNQLLHDEQREPPTVEFTVDSEEAFWKQYKPLLHKIATAKGDDGKLLYFPWKARTYKNPTTTDNIIKMWHSIQSVWNLMERHEKQQRQQQYTTVLMLRSDVVYMTPIDVYEYNNNQHHQQHSTSVVVPGFGKHPVSDRIVYGPREAVRIWATERFDRLENHVQFMLQQNPGWGLHSERFVHYALFPAMRQAVVALRKQQMPNVNNNNDADIEKDALIVEHPYMCFFRARADETVWVSDCDGSPEVSAPTIRENLLSYSSKPDVVDMKGLVEDVLGRACPGTVTRLRANVRILDCSSISSSIQQET